MNLNMGLYQRQTLKMNLSQEVVQAIGLLQYTSMELGAFLEKMAMENPLIEVDTYYYVPKGLYKTANKKSENKTDFIQMASAPAASLKDHLWHQLVTVQLTPPEKKFLSFLIQSLDSNGYLDIELAEASEILKIPLQTGKKVLNILQSLEPAGIGARNLQECLILQLERKGKISEEQRVILQDYFDDFVHKRWKTIGKKLKIPLVEIQHLFDRIQKLDPRPGLSYSNERTEYIIPDVILEWKSDGWNIKITEDLFFK